MKRPGGLRDRRPVMSMPTRGRPLPPPARSYERRAPGMLIFMHLIGCYCSFSCISNYVALHFLDSSFIPEE